MEKIQKKDLGSVKSLLPQYGDVNSQDSWGDTLLHAAARSGSRKCVQFLLSQDADPLLLNEAGESAKTVAQNEDIKADIQLRCKEHVAFGTEIQH